MSKINGDATRQIVVQRQILQAWHIQGIKGFFQLCDIIWNAQAFVISNSTPLKRVCSSLRGCEQLGNLRGPKMLGN
jgi:hypothetical protein